VLVFNGLTILNEFIRILILWCAISLWCLWLFLRFG